jgi:hypothetical protein
MGVQWGGMPTSVIHNFGKSYESVRRNVLCNTSIESRIPMKLFKTN